MALRLTDLNDFITPSQACVKPMDIKKGPTSGVKGIKIDKAGGYIQIGLDGSETKLEKASITLSDCLACSGCVTSAESVLVELQNYKELLKCRDENKLARSENRLDDVRVVVVSVSPQSRASLAVKHGLSAKVATTKLVGLFKDLGADYVFDTTLSRVFSLIESQEEFVRRYREGSALPILSSSCPGWVCYAEKTQGEHVLPYISTAKSPQQVMGSLVKDYLCKQLGTSPGKIFHVSVMPCFDKKLEASRDDFYQEMYDTRDVDCVITTGEVEQLLMDQNRQLSDYSEVELSSFSPEHEKILETHAGGGSGGYLEHVFKYAAKELFQETVEKLEYVQKRRSTDFQEVTLKVNGEEKLKFALAYGFKNIQNIVRKIKLKKCPYQYIEIMACPKGCNNGGGQLAPLNSSETPEELWKKVEDRYNELPVRKPEENTAVDDLYEKWLSGKGSEKAKEILHTAYHPVEKTVIPHLEQW